MQTFGIVAIRGAGKTVLATDMAEEFCEAGLPWISFDPVGVWYGLRSTPDGKPGGYPVLVIGGEHADYPVDRTQGAELARALMADPVCAVIDVSQESKTFWRTFLTDFCLELMKIKPKIPRHIFIEEAPEFVPQKSKQDLSARCKEAVERLIRLGRNNGYGATLISQRCATVDKDVFSQCENIFALRTPGAHDRKALKEWVEAQASDQKMDKFLKSVGGLPNGEAYFWSPQWRRQFSHIKIRQRKTFHPGRTRTLTGTVKAAVLCDVQEFRDRLAKTMKRIQKNPPVRATAPRKKVIEVFDSKPVGSAPMDSATAHIAENINMIEVSPEQMLIDIKELEGIKQRALDATRRLDAVRNHLRPNYETMKTLFEDLGDGEAGPGTVDMEVWKPWLLKAGRKGAKRMLEVMLKRGTVTRNQLGTLSGISTGKSTFRAYLGWLKKNGLVRVDGETVTLLNP